MCKHVHNWLQAERARKNTESELSETSQRITELTTMLNSASADRSRFDAEMSSARADVDDALRERTEAAERAAKLQVSRVDERAVKLEVSASLVCVC